MNKHTPGPWHFRAAIQEGQFVVRDRGSSGGFADIARVKGDKRSTLAQAEANARLMSAAPDLLDALETAPVNGLGWTDEELDAWLVKARSAIDKARGL
jgi:hypothetical protein